MRTKLQGVRLFGVTVGEGWLRPQKQKVDAIVSMAKPHTKKQLRQFLGLVGYYSHFIRDFATQAAPLTDRLTKWSPDTL